MPLFFTIHSSYIVTIFLWKSSVTDIQQIERSTSRWCTNAKYGIGTFNIIIMKRKLWKVAHLLIFHSIEHHGKLNLQTISSLYILNSISNQHYHGVVYQRHTRTLMPMDNVFMFSILYLIKSVLWLRLCITFIIMIYFPTLFITSYNTIILTTASLIKCRKMGWLFGGVFRPWNHQYNYYTSRCMTMDNMNIYSLSVVKIKRHSEYQWVVVYCRLVP